MVMHSNVRGEFVLRTLVDRQRKRLVDVVVRHHNPTDQAPKLRHLRVLAHVQLDDDPRTPIQQNVREEFRQHDGVVTILMFYRRRASPKHRYNIIEDYGGRGTPHTAKNMITWINLCVYGCPLPPYIKDQRGGAAGQEEGAPGGVLLPPGVGFPPFPSWNRIREGGKRRERRKGGAAPLSLSYLD